MKTVIAFAYAQAVDQLAASYYGLAEDLVKNVREVMPGVEIIQISDDKAHMVPGVNGVLRVARDLPLMVWRLKAHQLAHSLAEQIMFAEPDVRFKENILDVFDDSDFDVAITKREMEVDWGEEKLSFVAPYTMGSTISRSAEFWRDCKVACQKLNARDQAWIGDMKSMAKVIEEGKYKVKFLEGPIYNHVPNARDEIWPGAKVLHFKGKRKQWLFKKVSEAV